MLFLCYNAGVMLADYHVHSQFSDDSDYEMEEVVKDAIAFGLDEICFTDHVDYGVKLDHGVEGTTPRLDEYGMPIRNVDYPRYFEKIDVGLTRFPGTSDSQARFAVSSSIGYDAQICHKALVSRLKKFLNFIGKGRLVYYITGIFLIFKCPHTKAEIIIDGKRKLSYKKLIFASAMNTKYEGGGMPMGPAADPTDGKVTMCIVHDISRIKHLLYMPSVIKADHVNKRGVEQITCRTCEIRTERPLCVHTDGEPAGVRDHVIFSCTGDKLRIMR